MRATILAIGLTAAILVGGARAQSGADPSEKAPPAFDGLDAMGLVERTRIETDCRIDWSAPDGRRYCFGSTEAKSRFVANADENIRKAEDMLAAREVEDVGRAMEKFTSKDAKQHVVEEIEAASKTNGGTYIVKDPVTNTSIPMVYDGVDFTRTLKGYGFFPDVRFAAKDDPQKTYLVDFWVAPRHGRLTTLEQRIYKAPYKDGDRWTMMQRQPKPWWWIPAAEHPGETEQKRSWEVMSSIDMYVQDEARKNHGVFVLKDDKTGQSIDLDFLYVHQPVRRLKSNGVFFACTDFRKAGSKDEIYDIDFWLDDKTGKVTVNQVKIHKVPSLRDGAMTPIPRYEFDPATYEQVP